MIIPFFPLLYRPIADPKYNSDHFRLKCVAWLPSVCAYAGCVSLVLCPFTFSAHLGVALCAQFGLCQTIYWVSFIDRLISHWIELVILRCTTRALDLNRAHTHNTTAAMTTTTSMQSVQIHYGWHAMCSCSHRNNLMWLSDATLLVYMTYNASNKSISRSLCPSVYLSVTPPSQLDGWWWHELK